jgi:REP element-mobilizing transposase RayT
MSRPLRIQYPDAYYHVTCRGNEQREIFREAEDRKEFLRLLARSVEIYEVNLFAYALMPNHFHLLLCTPKGNLSEFMRHFNISYTGSFNRKYKRTGHLYQGRYKAFLIDKNNYLVEVSRYIHLNPFRMQSPDSLEKRWQHLLISDQTSFPGYLDEKNRQPFVHYAAILDCFGPQSGESSGHYKQFVTDGLKEDITSLLEKGKGTGIIGEADFVEEIRQLFVTDQKDRQSQRERPALRELGKPMTPEELIDRYTDLVQKNRDELTSKGKQSTDRAILMELLYRFCNITQTEIGKLIGGIDYSAVSQARKRLRLKIKNETEWAMKFSQVENHLKEMSRVKI